MTATPSSARRAAPPTLGGLRRPFIWRPSINGGRPMDLMAYLSTLSPSSPIVTSGIDLTYATGISADGDSLLVQVYDAQHVQPARAGRVTFLNGILKLSGTPVCVAPRIGTAVGFHRADDISVRRSACRFGLVPLQYQWQHGGPGQPGHVEQPLGGVQQLPRTGTSRACTRASSASTDGTGAAISRAATASSSATRAAR